MHHKRLRFCYIVIKRNLLRQNGGVACLAHIGGGAGNQPERIVVKAAADVGVALLGKRLILMVGAAVLKLGGGNVDNPLSCPVRDQMHKAKKILTGIPEAHAASDAGLVVGSGAGHVECDHALVLIPDIDHTVNFIVGRLYGVF